MQLVNHEKEKLNAFQMKGIRRILQIPPHILIRPGALVSPEYINVLFGESRETCFACPEYMKQQQPFMGLFNFYKESIRVYVESL